MSGSLLGDESYADNLYGFPAGTMAALGMSESNQGTNLGSIGNIFQVTPSTAAQPGYGLTSVDGNSPTSVGAYLNALWQKLGGGVANLPAAIQQYQGGSAPNAAMSSFLGGLGGGATAAPTNAAGNPTAATPQAGTGTATATPSPASWLSSIGSFLGGYATRGALILLAIILLLGAVYLFAERTQSVSQS